MRPSSLEAPKFDLAPPVEEEETDYDPLSILVDMGFGEDRSRDALLRASGNPARAVDILINE